MGGVMDHPLLFPWASSTSTASEEIAILSPKRCLAWSKVSFSTRPSTFGVASASYWWGRIAGAGIRLVHELLGPEMPIEMLIFGSLGAGLRGRPGTVLSFLFLSTLGFPFKWAKQRGGLKVEWIGLYTDNTTMRLGFSPKSAAWMEGWTRRLASTGRVTAKEMEQGLGRLGFAANALTWERPFLGPL